MRLYRHWSDIPRAEWPWWQFFHPRELASHGDGSILVVSDAINRLFEARQLLAKPFVIHSAYRDPRHNALVGGAPLSLHKKGIAFDIGLNGIEKDELHRVCQKVGFTGFGLHYENFLHVDIGRERTW